jgi:hypothetical protein
MVSAFIFLMGHGRLTMPGLKYRPTSSATLVYRSVNDSVPVQETLQNASGHARPLICYDQFYRQTPETYGFKVKYLDAGTTEDSLTVMLPAEKRPVGIDSKLLDLLESQNAKQWIQ